jgi:hypothetical protein
MLLKWSLADYTEHEFIQLLQEIFFNAGGYTEEEHSNLVRHFVALVGHPAGSDLIFYPESGAEDSPEGVLSEVKKWREANGLPGFKAG